MKGKNEINFVHMDTTRQKLELATATNTNIILYGPGGFGKTEFVKDFLDKKGLTYSTVIGNKSLRLEELVGVADVSRFMNDSEFEVAFNKSPFMGADVLLLEEFLDVPDDIAAALKDIVSEGGFRTKTKFIASDIKQIIICTNRAPGDVLQTDSNKAFFNERFPIHHKVEWKEMSAKKYFDLLSSNTPLKETECNIISFLCQKAKVSPRIALKAAEIFNITKRYEDIQSVNGFTNLDIVNIVNNMLEKQEIKTITNSLNNVLLIINRYSKNLGVLIYLKDAIEEITFDDGVLSERAMSYITIKNSINLKIKDIHFNKKIDVDKSIRDEIDEVLRDLKNLSS